MNPAPGSIRTPDQRLRIFVSSTLAELATERKAVRRAIERLHLAPVMFELGARPHPPRDLYRAYLAQSDIFVGMYWERYGWVAPGENVSGLEDEYLLSSEVPKLIYIKEPSDERERRLTELLERVLTDGHVSYKRFSGTPELTRLIQEDLAILLAERFDQSRQPNPPAAEGSTDPEGKTEPAQSTQPAQGTEPDSGPEPRPPQPSPVPTPLTDLIGRERDVESVQRMLRRPGTRLVTLLGPGGVGKTRLAIGIASTMTDDFAGGTAFVSLAPLQSAAQVAIAIAGALGVRDAGGVPVEDRLALALRHREMLVVVDNFEHVLDAAQTLTDLLAAAPGLRMLVTSRSLLRVSAEQAYEVVPLELPVVERRTTVEAALSSPSVQLLVERARAVRPDFEVTDENAAAVAQICRELDGLPLAIELAAARIRMLPPRELLRRLDRPLPLLVGGVRDLPARQQTLRDTIEWSTQLLGDHERRLLALLGVFAGPFSFEAAEFLASDLPDPLTSLALLVDNSLVRQHDHDGRSLFTVLSTVREYASGQLVATGGLEAARSRHAEWYSTLADRVELDLEGPRQLELVASLADERDNLRATALYLIEKRDWSTLAHFVWALYIYWWVDGHSGEVHGWMNDVLADGDSLPAFARAVAQYFACALMFRQHVDEEVIDGLVESTELFRREEERSGEGLARLSLAFGRLELGLCDMADASAEVERVLELFRGADDEWSASLALIALGRLALAREDFDEAERWFRQGLDSAEKQHDELGESIALHHVGWVRLRIGDLPAARELFEKNLVISSRLGHDEGIAYAFEGLLAIAAATGDTETAGLLYGSTQALREHSGVYGTPASSFHLTLIEAIMAGDDAAAFEAARVRGWDAPLTELVERALALTVG